MISTKGEAWVQDVTKSGRTGPLAKWTFSPDSPSIIQPDSVETMSQGAPGPSAWSQSLGSIADWLPKPPVDPLTNPGPGTPLYFKRNG
jgi:hypothetical protein